MRFASGIASGLRLRPRAGCGRHSRRPRPPLLSEGRHSQAFTTSSHVSPTLAPSTACLSTLERTLAARDGLIVHVDPAGEVAIAHLIPGSRVEGRVSLAGRNVYGADVNAVELRRRVGMVFQKLNPFPKSIFDNVAYGLRIGHNIGRTEIADVVEKSLRAAALWEEVKDRLNDSALALSGGQQQRLCIARALAIEPEVLLMDEPASALDPIATQRIEELIYQLKSRYTIVIVTHNMQQAARVSDVTAFFWLGRLVEVGRTDAIFTNPREKLTEDYVTGRCG